MSENWQIALFSLLGSGIGALILAFTTGSFHFNRRLTRIETFVEIAGSAAFKGLHREDDKFGLDELVDKYHRENDDLPTEDWIKVFKAATKLAEDPKLTEAKGALALAAAFAAHKVLGRDPKQKDLLKGLLK